MKKLTGISVTFDKALTSIEANLDLKNGTFGPKLMF